MSLKAKLAAIQVAMKAPKNLTNKFGGYNYRNAEGILEAFKPYGKEHAVGLTVGDEIEERGGRIYVKATATIFDTETEETISNTAYAREPEAKKGMDEAQITGAASSYARKYALNGLFLLDDTKDADSDEYTAKAKGMDAEELKEQKKDYDKTKETADTPISETHMKALLTTFDNYGLKAADVYKHYGITKKSDITYGLLRIINGDLKELVKEYGNKQ